MYTSELQYFPVLFFYFLFMIRHIPTNFNESVNNINTALIYDKCLNAKIKKINL